MTWPPLRPELVGVSAYGAPQLAVSTAINVNENPYGPNAGLAALMGERVKALAGELNRYPDREFVALREALADYLGHGVSAAQVWAANGSNEVMQQLLQAFGGPGRCAVSFAPTYSMYPEYARNTHTRWVVGRRRNDFSLDLPHALAVLAEEQPHVVFVTSPNNPTGTALELAHAAELAAAIPNGLLVVDEAYAEFRRDGTPSALSLLAEHRNLVVSRTMSKAFGLAGARVGYFAADPAIADAVRIVRLPYHLSATTQAVALAALEHAPMLLATVDQLRCERDRLVTWLREHAYQVADSDANFVLFGKFADRHAVWEALLAQGVLVRETGPSGWLRASIGTPTEMAALRAALVSDSVRSACIGARSTSVVKETHV